MTLQFESSHHHTKAAKNSVLILALTFIGGLLLTQISRAETLISGDSDWALFAGVMSEYSEFGDANQALLAVGQVGMQLTTPAQGLAFAVYGKSSISDFTPVGGQYNAAGVSIEYLYQPSMTGFFSGGANLGLSLISSDTALHSEIFGRYRISINHWLQAGVHGGYRLAPDHASTSQTMTGLNAAVFFNFGNF